MLAHRQDGEYKEVNMIVYALTRHMNDYGTKPRIRVLKRNDSGYLLIFEGSIYPVDDEIGKLKVNSFTVIGRGHLEIYCE